MQKKILMADDSRVIRDLVRQILQADGYEIVEACDGAEALERVKEESFDLLITDLNMPRLDGIGLIREVRCAGDNRFLPIVMLTGEDGADFRERGRSAGATCWIVKPFKSEQLLSVVRGVLT